MIVLTSRSSVICVTAVLALGLTIFLFASDHFSSTHTDLIPLWGAHTNSTSKYSSSPDNTDGPSGSTDGGEVKSKNPKYKKPTPSSSGHERPKVNPGGNDLAYVTWLAGNEDANENLNEDRCFIAARILVWHLLHNPSTRTTNIDVVVMVDPLVSQSRRDRLAKDGAIIYPIEFLRGTIELHPEHARWKNVMTKLRVFQMTQYSRILFLDSDTMLLHPLDGIFDDPAAQLQTTLSYNSTDGLAPVPDGLAPIPQTYLLAGLSEVKGSEHHFPPTREDLGSVGYMNSGFFLLAPGAEIFAHYESYLNVPVEKFNSKYPEQNLLRTAHGWDGPMPWKEVDYTWNIREPNENDFEKGVVSVHEKWWNQDFIVGNQKVKDWMQTRRWEMKGWYDAYDQLFDD